MRSELQEREIRALRERLSRLSAASRRLNESLEFDQVLQGALDSARALTGARHGVMTLLDGGGASQEFLSSGLRGEEAERLWLMPEGLRIFRALTGVCEPLRLPDLVAHLRGLGFSGFTTPMAAGPVYPFLAAPILHRGERVGHLFVGDREGRAGVQPGGRGDAGDVRGAGGAGDRQRAHPPGGAAGAG